VAACGALAIIAMLGWFDPRQFHLPVCWLFSLTGRYCPGCGATRATHELLHGHVGAAWHDNALWITGLPLYAYVALSEWRMVRHGRPLPGNLSRQPWFWIALAVAVALFGVLRNLPGDLGASLTPR